jgi:CrcB protein
MWKSVLAVSTGGTLGCLLRWYLGLALNSLFPTIPPGTLAVNLIGGYIIGMAIAFFGSFGALPPEWRLFVITGFCGGLTTFSTFSAELYSLMVQGRMAWAFVEIAIHVTGSLTMTFLGAYTVTWLLRG